MRLKLILGCAVCMLLTGCAWLNPGGQVQKGMAQSKIYEWRENGAFWSEAVGTHEEEFTMAEGELVMRTDAEGNVVIDWDKSRITHYLHARPRAKAAGSAMSDAFAASTAQAQVMADSFAKLVDVVAAQLPGGAATPSTGIE